MACLINVANRDEQPLVCGRPCAGVIWWDGEGYADAACAVHLGAFGDEHRIELGRRLEAVA